MCNNCRCNDRHIQTVHVEAKAATVSLGGGGRYKATVVRGWLYVTWYSSSGVNIVARTLPIANERTNTRSKHSPLSLLFGPAALMALIDTVTQVRSMILLCLQVPFGRFLRRRLLLSSLLHGKSRRGLDPVDGTSLPFVRLRLTDASHSAMIT